ncbi:MAG: outer membrane protein assembly factor BamD [Phycisphaerales bacterium JB039]
MRLLLALLLTLPLAPDAGAQHNQYTLTEEGQWELAAAPTDPDELFLAEAARLINDGRPGRARTQLNEWIRRNNFSDNPWLPTALRLRGEAKLAAGNEWDALYDFEEVALAFPESPEYVTVIEREFDIAADYLRGKKRKILGLRIVSAYSTGVEIMIRVVERLPQSTLAEESFRELAQYFLRQRDLASAALVGQKFDEHFATSAMSRDMLLLRITTNWARFKGPRYNGAALVETRALAERYLEEYPTDENRSRIEAILVRVDNSAGEHMLEKARWYLQRGDTTSARFTLQRLLRRHPETAATAEAMQIMEDRGWLDIVEQGAAP